MAVGSSGPCRTDAGPADCPTPRHHRRGISYKAAPDQKPRREQRDYGFLALHGYELEIRLVPAGQPRADVLARRAEAMQWRDIATLDEIDREQG